MYIPRPFAKEERAALLEFVDSIVVATLVTAGPAGLMANQVPLLRQPGADRLWGHLARPNPQLEELRQVEEALLIFNGPHGYVSPNWYSDPNLVPTWNFTTVQVRGRVTVHDDVEVVQDIVERLTARHESAFEIPWTTEKMADGLLEKMLGAIVGFHVEIDDLRGKYKLSQNRSPADRATVAAGFEATGNTELAALMREVE